MMLTGYTPYTFPELFRAIILGKKVSPGTVTISGHDRVKNWDVQAAKGSTGASSKRNGDPIGKFTATFYLAGDENDEDGLNDFSRWADFQLTLESIVDGETSSTLPVYHPDLCANHFTEVSVAKIGGIVRDNLGGATVAVDFIEYRPAKKKPVTKATSKASATTGPAARPDPNAQRKKEVAALLAEAKKP